MFRIEKEMSQKVPIPKTFRKENGGSKIGKNKSCVREEEKRKRDEESYNKGKTRKRRQKRN